MSDQEASVAQEEPGAPQPPAPAPVAPAVASAQRLADAINKKREEHLSAGIKSKPRTSIWASQISDCERQMVYEFLNWQDKKLHDWKLEALFAEGRKQEELFKAQLRELGFELVEDGAPISDDMRRKYGVNGYIDTRIKHEGKRIIVEMKLMNPMMFDRIRPGVQGVEDFRRSPFYKKYLRQGLLYMLGCNEEVMMFALTNGRGEWKFVIMSMDYDEAESILKKIERVKDAVEKKQLPDRVPYDNELCGRCAFAHVCIPDINADPRVKVVDNQLMADMLARREQLEEKFREYAKIDKKVKLMLEGVRDGILTVGDFIVTRKLVLTTRYEVPDAIKAQYSHKAESFRTEFERFMRPDPEKIYMEPRRLLSEPGLDEG